MMIRFWDKCRLLCIAIKILDENMIEYVYIEEKLSGVWYLSLWKDIHNFEFINLLII
jgi:hypothetical protein